MNWIYYSFLAFLVFTLAPAHADSISITRNIRGSLILRAPTCEELTPHLLDLSRWKAKLSEPLHPAPEPKTSINGKCQINIDSLVPSFVKLLHGKRLTQNGANCINTALLALGLNLQLRYASEEELDFWIRSPYCKPVSQNQPKEPGDIGIIHAGKPNLHVFIYINERLSFHKKSYDRHDPPRFTELNSIWSFTGATPNLTQYYRCQGWQKEKLTDTHLEALRLFLPIETQISAYSSFGLIKPAIEPSIRTAQQRIFERISELQFQTQSDKNSLHLNFFLWGLLQGLESMQEQLRN